MQKETQKEMQRAITSGLSAIKKGLKPIKGLKGIKTAIEQLPERLLQRLPQQIGYPLGTAPPSYTSETPLPTTLEEEEEEEKEEEEVGVSIKDFFRDSDTTFGVYMKDNKLFWGDKKFNFDGKNIYIGGYKFNNTRGLMHLITSKSPTEQLFKTEDKEAYDFILDYTNTMHRGNNPENPYPKSSRSTKWLAFVKPVWDARKRKKVGKGIVIPSDPNALLEKLDLLMASKAAGNTGVRNELVSVCDELKRQGVFDSDIYKKIMSLL